MHHTWLTFRRACQRLTCTLHRGIEFCLNQRPATRRHARHANLLAGDGRCQTSGACAHMQDPADAGAVPAVQQLFGVETQSRLVCEESGEAIEEGNTLYELK